MVEMAQVQPLPLTATPWLQPAAPAARLIFCGDEPAERALIAVLGFPEPPLACRAIARGPRSILWLGPDERLLLVAPEERLAMISGIATALSSHAHALVDVSHRQLAFELRGAQAVRLLNAQCPLDLAPAAFPVGMCTRTIFSKAEIVLWRTAPDVFHVEVWRSFSDYVLTLLRAVARECAQ